MSGPTKADRIVAARAACSRAKNAAWAEYERVVCMAAAARARLLDVAQAEYERARRAIEAEP